MVDVVDRKTRSRMMAGIKGKNTQPEIFVRRLLHNAGFRYRLHAQGLAGRPDLVLRRLNVVVFVHGCFWHAHRCSYFKLPGSNPEFWARKLNENVARDRRNVRELRKSGWRVLVVWECAVRAAQRDNSTAFARIAVKWLRKGSEQYVELKGNRTNAISVRCSTSRSIQGAGRQQSSLQAVIRKR